MDLVIREYEVRSRKDGATLITRLQETGYNIKLVVPHTHKAARIPEISYYQVWSDGTITRDDVALDFPDVKSCNYQLTEYTESTVIEPLKTI